VSGGGSGNCKMQLAAGTGIFGAATSTRKRNARKEVIIHP